MKKRVYFSIIAIILCLNQIIFLGNSFRFGKSQNVFNVVQNDTKAQSDVKLQDDFYTAVNKDWLKKTKLIQGNISYGTFEELCVNVNENIKSIISDIERNKEYYEENTDEMKLLNLYNNYLNISERNENGIEPIKEYMNKVDDIKNVEDLKEALSDKELSYFNPLISLGVGPDYKDSSMNVLYIGASNLGLGNSLYYKNEEFAEVKKAYIDYISKLHMLYGEDENEAKHNGEEFYNTEKKLADDIRTFQEESQDNNRIENSYNIFTLNELEETAPNIEFTEFLCKYNLEHAKKIIVENPKNISKINSLITSQNLDEIKNYLKTNILINSDGLLTTEFRKASSGIRKVLYGAEVCDITENSAVKFVSGKLNGIVSKLYVEKYFDKESKEEVEELVFEIIDNFKKRLQNNSWMSETTKEQALNKLKNINVKVGYPNKWRDYDKLKIESIKDKGNLVKNVINIYNEEVKNEFLKINEKVDKDEWNMGTFTVNAYYNPLNNEIVFPAAILQEPFYSRNSIKEKNLGGIGAVIGHELTHAFDNIGAKFDENGKLKNWWTENDYIEFENRSKKVVDYYSKVEAFDGEYVDGCLTAGENISDLGGVACVLDVAKKLENPNYKALFENYATIWREVSTKELKEYLLKNDPHSPKKVRVNCVLSQFEEFYKTYNIKCGDKMYVNPEKRIGIW